MPFVSLRNWGERDHTAKELVDLLNIDFHFGINEAQVFAFGPPAIPGLGSDNRIPREEVARSIVEEIRGYKKDFPSTIYLVDVDAGMLGCFQRALENALSS